jgi:hypothetical protein
MECPCTYPTAKVGHGLDAERKGKSAKIKGESFSKEILSDRVSIA